MDNIKANEIESTEVQALKDKLRELIRHASVSRLKIHADFPDVEIRELDSGFRPGRVLASNMVFILVSGDAVRLTFKVHFNTGTAKNLAFRIFGGESPAGIPAKRAIDYFKEYGNLVAGNVVTLLGRSDIELGISLPLCTRGLYEVFADYSEKHHPVVAYSDFWELKANGHDVFCSAQFEILDKKPLEKLAGYAIEEETGGDDEEIDFL